MIAAMMAEMAPTHPTISNTPGVVIEKTGNNLATKKTTATTIVAACINAETGVGPSIASGNQICNGNIADLPAPPMNTNVNAQVSALTPTKDAVVIAKNWDDCCEVKFSINVLKSSVSP